MRHASHVTELLKNAGLERVVGHDMSEQFWDRRSNDLMVLYTPHKRQYSMAAARTLPWEYTRTVREFATQATANSLYYSIQQMSWLWAALSGTLRAADIDPAHTARAVYLYSRCYHYMNVPEHKLPYTLTDLGEIAASDLTQEQRQLLLPRGVPLRDMREVVAGHLQAGLIADLYPDRRATFVPAPMRFNW